MNNRIAIIVVTYNSAKWIANCLRSVFASKLNGHIEVTVIDNASSDGSADIVEKEFLEVDLIRLKENTGFVGGNNLGIERAMSKGCDYIFLLNPDTEIEPNCLSEIVKVADQDKIGIVQAMLLLGDERHLTNNVGNALHYLGFGFVKHYREDASQWLTSEPLEIGYASGAAMLIKREVFYQEKEGTRHALSLLFLDKKLFSYNEDQDLCWRVRLGGYKIMLAPKAVVYHYYEFSRNKFKFYWNERNRWVLLLQNYSVRTLLLLSPMLLLIELMMLVYSLLGGWLHLKLKSYAWIFVNLSLIFRDRAQVQSIRKVSDKKIFLHMDSKLEMSEVDNPVLKYIVSPFAQMYFKIIKIFI